MIRRKSKILKVLACLVAFNFLFEMIWPTAVWALTSGPTSPEFSSFEPVSTTNMVNPQTGQFTYNLPVVNVPGANGGGYAMSLSYHSGTSSEEEASWVGYGWTLNPGSIMRGKKGHPDDYKGENVTYWNKNRKNWTMSVGGSTTVEAFSADIPIGINGSIRYNNYKGFGYSVGAGLNISKGLISLGVTKSDGDLSFDASVNPAALFGRKKKQAKETEEKSQVVSSKEDFKNLTEAEQKSFVADQKKKARERTQTVGQTIRTKGSNYGLQSFAITERPSQVSGYTGTSVNLTYSVEPIPGVIPVGPEFGLNANYSEQTPVPNTDHDAYGYFYNADALDDDEAIMDYTLEKESTYNVRDRYTSIPHSGADQYSLTGEGLAGGFRLWHDKAGHYRPNHVKSRTIITQTGAEIQAITNIGLGGDVGLGQQVLEVEGKWKANGNVGEYQFNTDSEESRLFRFHNDLGGSVEMGETGIVQADLKRENAVPGIRKFSPQIPSSAKKNITSKVAGENRVGRSSYIGYHTYNQMDDDISGQDAGYKSYNKNSEVKSFIDGSNLQDAVGEFAIWNEDGNRYLYGLPVYSRNEKNLNYGLGGVSAASIDSNHTVHATFDKPKDAEVVIGEERDAPYSTMYLLTEITTPDYVDITQDGPSRDDLGGYTRFGYRQVYGGTDKRNTSDENFYKWRIPYSGLMYQRGTISDQADDMGAIMMGEKEIYYLKTIETKTHVAVFITNKSNFQVGNKTFSGSQKLRKDGYDAEHDEAVASGQSSAQGVNELEYLEKIELYKVDENGNPTELIRTAHFDYDYSVVKGLPNSPTGSGKLTLKKVWFTANGIYPAKISPYQFGYKYRGKGFYAQEVKDRYLDICSYSKNWNADEQNPRYSRFQLDAWGNYQDKGGQRYLEMKTWLDQNPNENRFDPAAWQLKRITLPTGGEIHIHYEQNDYQYVQNRNAMAMVALTNDSKDDFGLIQENKFYLNTQELGITNMLQENELMGLIKKLLIDKEEKIYFKFLYAMIGLSADLDKCSSEYINGYATVKGVGRDGNGVWIKLGDDTDFSVPRSVCLDFVENERAGKMDMTNNCDASVSGLEGAYKTSGKELAMALLGKIGNTFKDDAVNCLAVNWEKSYLRIPLPFAKKGGGVRVKRLLMYDEGLEAGDAVMYGNEYFYKTYDADLNKTISSGVASNEPGGLREENPLIGFLPKREEKKLYHRIISGKDKEEFEGPLGEYFLPSASITYSEVHTVGIHRGATNSGFTVAKYYTTKDHPYDGMLKELGIKGADVTTKKQKKDWMLIPAIYANYSVNNLWVTQGYQFIKTNFVGRPKSVASYSGFYDSRKTWKLISSTEHQYYQPGEKIPMMYDLDDIRLEEPGKDMELLFEQRKVSDVMKDANLEGDVSVGLALFIPLPFGSVFPSITYAEKELHTHVTVKTVSYPVIEKSVRTFSDGIYHHSENLAHDPLTGGVLVRRDRDGFHGLDLEQSASHDGSYTTYNFPASRYYERYGQKAMKNGKTVTATANTSMKLNYASPHSYHLEFTPSNGESSCDLMGQLGAGDLVEVTENIGVTKLQYGLFHVGKATGNDLRLHPHPEYYNLQNASSGNVTVKIVESGRNNRLNTSVGSITTYGDQEAPQAYSINATALSAREKLVDSLNLILANGGNGTILGANHSSLQANASGCVNMPYNMYLNFDGDNNTGTIEYYPKDSARISYTYTEYVQNSTLDETLPCPGLTPFNDHCINHWKAAFGTPGWAPWDPIPESNEGQFLFHCEDSTQFWGEGIYQNDVNLTPGQSYVLDFYFKMFPGDTLCEYGFYMCDKDSSNVPVMGPIHYPPHDLQQLPLGLKGRRLYIRRNATEPVWTNVRINFVHDLPNRNQLVFFGAQVMGCDSVCRFKGIIESMEDLGIMKGKTCPPDAQISIANVRIYEKDSSNNVLCTDNFDLSGGMGEFKLNRKTGQIEYYTEDNTCYPYTFGTCLDLCPDAGDRLKMGNVLAANASYPDDYWVYPRSVLQQSDIAEPTTATARNPYAFAQEGKWRTKSSYVYRTSIVGGADDSPSAGERNYKNAGVFDEFTLFDWEELSANDPKSWLLASTVTRCLPNGEPSEEVDALGIPSSARFGYYQSYPYMVTQNAKYDFTFFESFEMQYEDLDNPGTYVTENELTATGIVDTEKHSGEHSFEMSAGGDPLNLPGLTLHVEDTNTQFAVRMWVYEDPATSGCASLTLQRSEGGSWAEIDSFKTLAWSGKWKLVEAVDDLSTPFNFSVQVGFSFEYYRIAYDPPMIACGSPTYAYLDDIRFMPLEAQAKCWVYDPVTGRAIASFDDQLFGTYYQYDGEGKLLRKKLETERGIRTVSESYYHTPKTVNRP
ncbi:hypothetical protein KFE98_14410 [bacterium SCSIO 12741]|nr:hypothetical protein KFE98_14410 [bacterium SCSIO 12741]